MTGRKAVDPSTLNRLDAEAFRLLVDSVKDYAIFMLDVEGRIRSWNAGARELKGYSEEEVLGRHISTFYTDEDRRGGLAEKLLRRAEAEGRVEDEGWRVRKDGTRFWADVVITALRDAKGKLVGFAKVTRDLTERRRAEEERRRLIQAREAIRLRDEFLTIASHELKTPLTAIQLQLQNLAHRLAENPEISKRIVRAKRSGDRLAALIDSLFDVSRIATGRYELRLEPFDLSCVVLQVVETFQGTAASVGSTLSVKTPGAVQGTWDRVRIEQVLANLISNALKYGAAAPVDVTLSREREEAVIEVRDQGPGIPPEDLKRVFDRFERASSPRHFGGLGLGLYVTREIVRAHGGSVDAVNNPDKGATFRAILPLRPVRRVAPDDAAHVREAG